MENGIIYTDKITIYGVQIQEGEKIITVTISDRPLFVKITLTEEQAAKLAENIQQALFIAGCSANTDVMQEIDAASGDKKSGPISLTIRGIKRFDGEKSVCIFAHAKWSDRIDVSIRMTELQAIHFALNIQQTFIILEKNGGRSIINDVILPVCQAENGETKP